MAKIDKSDEFAETRSDQREHKSMLRPIVTSHSIDGTYETCPRLFEFKHVWLKTKEREEDTFAADVGTALHEATQEWQRHVVGAASDERMNPKQVGAYTLLKFWPWEWEEERLRTGKPIGARTVGNAILMFEAICKSPIWRDWELVQVDNFGPAIEVPFRINHHSIGTFPLPHKDERGYFVTQGKIDFILRHRKTGVYRVLDLKSTEKSLPGHDAAFRFNGQVGSYGLVLNHALGLDWEKNGLDVIYLILYFDPENGPRVYPIEYHLPPREVQDAIDVKLERLYRMKEYAERKYWPRRAHGCEFYGRPCAFLDICARRDEDYIRDWFRFEEDGQRFEQYDRVYEPVWTLEA